METLAGELAETVDFATIACDKMLFLDQVAGRHRLMAVSHIGDEFPLYCSSVGKAYLATLTPEQIEKLIGTKYERRTPATIITMPALLAELETIRETGIGLDLEEHSAGICAVGFCFSDEADNWFGLSIPVPTQRFEQQRNGLINRMIEIRNAL